MTKLVAAILIDSLRHDFVTKGNTPFLHSLLGDGVSGTLVPPFSFALHPTWFAGLYPQDSNLWIDPVYSPSTSPYKLTKPISSSFFSRFERLTKYCNIAMARWLVPNADFAIFTPLNVGQYFDYSEKYAPWSPSYLPGRTTLFDILRREKLKWLFIGAPGSNQRTLPLYWNFSNMLSKGYSFIWLHFAELDWACHGFGPTSVEVRQKLETIDKVVHKIYRQLRERYEDVTFFFFGDHGSVEVRKVLDFDAILRRIPLTAGHDYLYFLGGTTARFWFRTEKSMGIIRQSLHELSDGKILEDADMIKFRCNLGPEYGEIIWVANEATLILPNYFSGRLSMRAMHGYLPIAEDNQSKFVAVGPSIKRSIALEKPREMVDVFPTLLDLLGLPVPESNQGKSIMSPDNEVRHETESRPETLWAFLSGGSSPHQMMERSMK